MSKSIIAKKKHNNAVGKTTQDKILDGVITVILVAAIVVSLYPLYYTVIASLSNPVYISRGEIILFPKGLTFAAYDELLATKEIWIGYRNSLFYTIAYTLLNLIVTLPCAYALSRQSLPGQKKLFMFFLVTMYVSGGTIPTYLLINSLGLIDTVWIMILPTGVSTFNLIICRNYFHSNVPDSLFEAASIDGASITQFFVRFVVPLSKPIISVLSLYFAIGKWNDYMGPMLYIQDPNKQTLQVKIKAITATLDSSMADQLDADQINEAMQRTQLLKYSVVVVSALPLILLYPFVQKFLIGGMMVGSVKE